MKKPNIVLFVADELRYDALGAHGCRAAKTPNIDGFARESVSFTNAYCQNPVCVPSRCSFLTGLYPHTKGHRTMHYLLEEDDRTVLEEIKKSGYKVYWIGKNDVYPIGRKDLIAKACDEYFEGVHPVPFSEKKDIREITREEIKKDVYYYSHYVGKISEEEAKRQQDWVCMKRVLEILDTVDPEQPFCLCCTLFYPHSPYMCEEPWYSSIDRSLIEGRRPDIETLKDKPSMLYGIREKQNLQCWTEDMFTELRATYYAMVSRLDYHFGLILDKLRERKMYDDTNIIFTSDHGDYTGDYGLVEKSQNTFEDPVAKVPLLIKPSKEYEVKPRKSAALVELTDLPATLADMAQIKLGYVQFGKSLMHAVAGDEEHRREVFCSGGRVHGEDYAKESGHTYLSYMWPRLETQQSEGPEHTKAIMVRSGNYKYVKRLYEKDELYNLEADPEELNNVIENPEYESLIKEFQLKILDHLIRTGDYVPQRKDRR